MPGETRMRVQILYSATPDPCLESFSYGEVEDYAIIVESSGPQWLTIDGGYAIIFDTASGASILYSNPKFDKSDEVLQKLGYKN